MSEMTEVLARQILEATDDGKLAWTLVPNSTAEEFRAEVEDGQSIAIRRVTQRDDKMITLELSNPSGVILTDQANNFISAATGSILASLHVGLTADAIMNTSSPLNSDISKFTLFNDLFLAAKRNATGEDTALAKFQVSLDRVSKGAA
jgi:hypothetical protein